MQRIRGWLLIGATFAGFGGLRMLAQSYEPPTTCATQRAEGELASDTRPRLLDVIDPIVHSDLDLPSREIVFSGVGRRHSEAAGACEVAYASDRTSTGFLSVISFARYLDDVDSLRAFRYSDYPDERESNATQSSLIDPDRRPDKPTWGFETRHRLGCMVLRVNWRPDPLPDELDSPSARDEFIRLTFDELIDLC